MHGRSRSKRGGGDVKDDLRGAQTKWTQTKWTLNTHHSRQPPYRHLRACLRPGLGLAAAFSKPRCKGLGSFRVSTGNN